jgi:hypothetical protein
MALMALNWRMVEEDFQRAISRFGLRLLLLFPTLHPMSVASALQQSAAAARPPAITCPHVSKYNLRRFAQTQIVPCHRDAAALRVTPGEEEGEEISETGNLGWILETDTRYKISQRGAWLGVNKNR